MQAPQVYRVGLNRDCTLKEPTVLGNEGGRQALGHQLPEQEVKSTDEEKEWLEWVEAVAPSWVPRRLPGGSSFEGFSGRNSVGSEPKVTRGGSV